MAQPKVEAPPLTSSPSSKQVKGIKEILRSFSPSPSSAPTPDGETPKDAAKDPKSPRSKAKAVDPTPDPIVKEDAKGSTAPTGSAATAEWDDLVGGLKDEKKKKKGNPIFEQLKRVASKGGKSNKGKEAEGTGDQESSSEAPKPLTDIASPPRTPPPPQNESGDILPGSNTLGRRIQKLLSNVPPFYHTDIPTSPDDGPGIPKPEPPSQPPITDSKLLSLLSSSSIMNGLGIGTPSVEADKKVETPPVTIDGASTSSKNTKSVWSVLDRLVPYHKPKEEGSGGEPDPEDEETSVMLYAPLVPDDSSQVTLAKSRVVDVGPQEEQQAAEITGAMPKAVAKDIFSALWPEKLKVGGKKKRRDSSSSVTKGEKAEKDKPLATPATKPDLPRTDSTAAPAEPKQVKVWIPSKTKMSLQVAWWGYRLWLPPPVMAILDDEAIEAAKRAAMITTALTWLVSHIPTTGLPPQLAVAVTLLKAIVPLTGYIGGFIAWSWGQIKSFNQGQGVVLSATWLLPIALIPGSWDEPEVPATTNPAPTPTPAPAPAKPGPVAGDNKPTVPPAADDGGKAGEGKPSPRTPATKPVVTTPSGTATPVTASADETSASSKVKKLFKERGKGKA